MYKYIYIYICIFVLVLLCVCVCVYIYIYIYVCICVCVCVCICVCVCVCCICSNISFKWLSERLENHMMDINTINFVLRFNFLSARLSLLLKESEIECSPLKSGFLSFFFKIPFCSNIMLPTCISVHIELWNLPGDWLSIILSDICIVPQKPRGKNFFLLFLCIEFPKNAE